MANGDGWKKVGGQPRSYLSAAKMQIEQEVIGVYRKSAVDPMYGSQQYTIETKDGEVILNGSGQLNFLMKGVPLNAEVKIVFKGKEKISKGPMAGKFANRFEVAVKEDEASAITPPSSATKEHDFAPNSIVDELLSQ